MGQTAGNFNKRFVNNPREVVADALEGYLWTHPDVQLLDGYPEVKVLVQSSWRRDAGRVAVVTGGGSGHEPAGGMIGDGLLTASVCGEIFASPSAFAVARALEAVTGPAGAIVVIRSNAGTRLNFLSAVKEVKSQLHLRVRVVCVADDVATSCGSADHADFRHARGIAGSLLICKIAGAAAAAGLSLDEVYQEAASAAASVRTQGVSFTSCSIPGAVASRPIPPDEMEIGMGIHGERGLRVKATADTTAREVVETMMSQLGTHVPPDVPLCVMINNLGAVPTIEMSVVAGEVMRSELGPRIKLLVGPAHLMTALETNGISISVLPLIDQMSADAHSLVNGAGEQRDGRHKQTLHYYADRQQEICNGNGCSPESVAHHVHKLGLRAERLLAPTTCHFWTPPVIPRTPQLVKTHYRGHYTKSKSGIDCFEESSHPVVEAMLRRVCTTLMDAEQELNSLDAAASDGDLGRNMARAAQTVMSALEDGNLPLAQPSLLFLRLGAIMRSVDGAMAAFLSVLFGKAGGALVPKRLRRLLHENKRRPKKQLGRQLSNHSVGWERRLVVEALRYGQREVESVGEKTERMGTFLDALIPAVRATETATARNSLYDQIHDGDFGGDDGMASMTWAREVSDGSEANRIHSEEDLEEEEEETQQQHHQQQEANISPRNSEESAVAWEAMASAAQEGARSTAGKKGSTAQVEGIADAGAMVVAMVFTAMAGPEKGTLRMVSDEAVGAHLELNEAIGCGTFGTVYLAKAEGLDHPVAVKVSKRTQEYGPRSFGDLDFLDRQIVSNWLFRAKPHITHVHEVIVSPTWLHVVMEHLAGPDLADWIISEEGQNRTESQVAAMLKQVLLAAGEVHAYGFVHRDLKFGNFRFANGPRSELKLVDVVGTMCFRPDRLTSKSWCGTGPFLSPESLLGDVCSAGDMWAIGVMAFQLLSGELPFPASSLSELHEAHSRSFSMEAAAWAVVSPLARSFVSQLLHMKEAERPTAEQALQFLEADGDGWLAHLRTAPGADEPLPLCSEDRQRTGPPGSWGALARKLKPPEVKTLYLVRHGEAVHNIEERQAKLAAREQALAAGLTPDSKDFLAFLESARKKVLEDQALHDAPLSPAGKTQALDALAEITKLTMQGHPKPNVVFVSPLQRTLQTAAVIFPDHPSIHVREELRERRTGLPCDERHRAEDVAMRQTFNFMSFEQLRNHDHRMPAEEDLEDKALLRCRTAQVEELLRSHTDRSLAVITHKGFLRELERGPLGRADASEFGNCEVRVYQVTLPDEGGMLAKLSHSRLN